MSRSIRTVLLLLGAALLAFAATACDPRSATRGNIPTEDLLYMLQRMGIETGVDLEASMETGRWLEDVLGRAVPGMLVKAGGFPAYGTH